VFQKRSNKYFPEYNEESNNSNAAFESILLKTIRIPKNIMHLSSRLPKKNYESSLIGGYSSEERKPVPGSNFKSIGHHHNTMGKKKSLRELRDNNVTDGSDASPRPVDKQRNGSVEVQTETQDNTVAGNNHSIIS